MARVQRVRELPATPPTREYLEEKAAEGWRLAALEWEREVEEEASNDHAGATEVPYGLRLVVIDDGRPRLEEDPAEQEVLLRILAGIVRDGVTLADVAGELDAIGSRTRGGGVWTAVEVFELLPRVVEAAPAIYASPAWRERHALSA